MRLNKNFANVYTPFHEFEDLDNDITRRKIQRIEKKDIRQAFRRQVILSNSLLTDPYLQSYGPPDHLAAPASADELPKTKSSGQRS